MTGKNEGVTQGGCNATKATQNEREESAPHEIEKA